MVSLSLDAVKGVPHILADLSLINTEHQGIKNGGNIVFVNLIAFVGRRPSITSNHALCTTALIKK